MLDNNLAALRGLGLKKYKLDVRQLSPSPIADSLFSGKRQNRGQTGIKTVSKRCQKGETAASVDAPALAVSQGPSNFFCCDCTHCPTIKRNS